MNSAECLAQLDAAILAVATAKNWKCARTQLIEDLLQYSGLCHADADTFGNSFSGQPMAKVLHEPETPEGGEPPVPVVRELRERYRAALGYTVRVHVGQPKHSVEFAEALALALPRRFADAQDCECRVTAGDIRLDERLDRLGHPGIALFDVEFEGPRCTESEVPVVASVQMEVRAGDVTKTFPPVPPAEEPEGDPDVED
ncbi:MAG: hypothetical protein KIT79_12625 [Deltaproteobacteria bacterium]|nr:hypothetical protein [Deltaproteobacteria bacterium]